MYRTKEEAKNERGKRKIKSETRSNFISITDGYPQHLGVGVLLARSRPVLVPTSAQRLLLLAGDGYGATQRGWRGAAGGGRG